MEDFKIQNLKLNRLTGKRANRLTELTGYMFSSFCLLNLYR